MHGVQQQTGEFDELCSFMHNTYSGWYGSLKSFWQPAQSHPSTLSHRQRHAQDARLWPIAARLEIQKYYSWLKYLRPIFVVLCPPTPIIWYTSKYQHRLAKRKIGADTGPTATLLWWLSWKGGEGGCWLLERCLYFYPWFKFDLILLSIQLFYTSSYDWLLWDILHVQRKKTDFYRAFI